MAASALYSLGVALQAMDAKRTPHTEHLRRRSRWNLVRRARWLAGTGLSMLGWPLQVVALLLAPLVVVQPTMAMGLLVLLFFGERMLDERAGDASTWRWARSWREWWARRCARLRARAPTPTT